MAFMMFFVRCVSTTWLLHNAGERPRLSSSPYNDGVFDDIESARLGPKAVAESTRASVDDISVEHIGGRTCALIEPDEHKDFLATLQRNGLAEGDFDLRETDTTDPRVTRTADMFINSNPSNAYVGNDVDSMYGLRPYLRSTGEYVVTKDNYNGANIVVDRWTP
ncbi:hypothetical protein PTKU46_97240 [Paraburkholderia terrae]|uniref:hypothetical protein n=1 Tax=Paraburkholderia terrae TaxID=311230 RepID=UPI0030E5F246